MQIQEQLLIPLDVLATLYQNTHLDIGRTLYIIILTFTTDKPYPYIINARAAPGFFSLGGSK